MWYNILGITNLVTLALLVGERYEGKGWQKLCSQLLEHTGKALPAHVIEACLCKGLLFCPLCGTDENVPFTKDEVTRDDSGAGTPETGGAVGQATPQGLQGIINANGIGGGAGKAHKCLSPTCECENWQQGCGGVG